jgi:predicted nucleic-acid-binding Zn-ribbon protein
MKTHQCLRCNSQFVDLQPQARALGAFTSHRIGLEEFTHITCPSCGNHHLGTERKFFGILGPDGLQVVVALVVACGIAAGIFSLIE